MLLLRFWFAAGGCCLVFGVCYLLFDVVAIGCFGCVGCCRGFGLVVIVFLGFCMFEVWWLIVLF